MTHHAHHFCVFATSGATIRRLFVSSNRQRHRATWIRQPSATVGEEAAKWKCFWGGEGRGGGTAERSPSLDKQQPGRWNTSAGPATSGNKQLSSWFSEPVDSNWPRSQRAKHLIFSIIPQIISFRLKEIFFSPQTSGDATKTLPSFFPGAN